MSGNYPDGVTDADIDAIYSGDNITDIIESAYIPHALAIIAYALGYDAIGDAAIEAISDALADDGVHRDDEEHARDYMDSCYSTPASAMKLLRDELDAVARRAALKDAKAAQVAL